MKKIVVYKSRTGFTKKYAEMISAAADCDICDFKSATAEKLSAYDVVIYGSRVHAGFIDGLKNARALFEASGAKKLVVFATGGTPNAAQDIVKQVWDANFSAEEQEKIPHFYMQSGINYEKMALPDKMIMKMAAKMMQKKPDKTPEEEGFSQAITQSYDSSSEEFIKPLTEYLAQLENTST